METSVGLIGCGKMGTALASAFVKKGVISSTQLVLFDKRPKQQETLATSTKGVEARTAAECCERSDVVLLAVKPQDFPALLTAIRDQAIAGRTFVSIAAGVLFSSLRAELGEVCELVRAMPNRPALVGAAVTALMGDALTSEDTVAHVDHLFQAAGSTVRLTDETHFDAATALSGSGPAFFFRLTEGLIAGGCRAGLEPEVAHRLAVATAYGAGKLLMETDTTPAEEREAVSSPGGTTVAGLAVLSRNRFFDTVVEAVVGAADRCRELGRS